MKNLTFKILALLLDKSDTKLGLKALEKALIHGIPFNIPHGFKLLKLDGHQAVMKLPFKRANKNHLGTAHACAIATLGEFPAGLLLIKNFSPEKYRVVMKELNVSYEKPGAGDLEGVASYESEALVAARKELDAHGHALVLGETDIFNSKGESIALVRTQWQLKKWSQTKHTK